MAKPNPELSNITAIDQLSSAGFKRFFVGFLVVLATYLVVLGIYGVKKRPDLRNILAPYFTVPSDTNIVSVVAPPTISLVSAELRIPRNVKQASYIKQIGNLNHVDFLQPRQMMGMDFNSWMATNGSYTYQLTERYSDTLDLTITPASAMAAKTLGARAIPAAPHSKPSYPLQTF